MSCPVEVAAFGRLIAEEAYEAGAAEVVMQWGDDKLSRMKFLKASDGIFDEVPAWVKTFYYEYAGKKAAMVNIYASDPENLKGVDPERLRRSANDSVMHEDFMVGTPDLSIIGVKASGEEIPVFVEGNFAF